MLAVIGNKRTRFVVHAPGKNPFLAGWQFAENDGTGTVHFWAENPVVQRVAPTLHFDEFGVHYYPAGMETLETTESEFLRCGLGFDSVNQRRLWKAWKRLAFALVYDD